MSDLKPVSVNGITYQVPAAIADAYGSQLAASQAGRGAPPDPDMIISAAAPGGSNAGAPGSSNDSGGAITFDGSNDAPPLPNNAPPLPLPSGADNTDQSASGTPIGGPAHADGVPFDGSTGPIGAPSAGADDPTVKVANNSSTPRYYKIEASAGCDPESLNNNIFVLQPGETATLNLGPGFIGAITDQGSQINSTNAGTRQEVNFGTPGKTWYDADLEFGGATESTLGPTQTSLMADDGRDSLVGNNNAYLTWNDDTKNRVISTQKMTITST